MPHFYGSSYNWSEHYEGYAPNAEKHQPYILLEPVTGIPVSEKYRFQSNIPVPDLNFGGRLKKYSNMMLPSFWYEFVSTLIPVPILSKQNSSPLSSRIWVNCRDLSRA